MAVVGTQTTRGFAGAVVSALACAWMAVGCAHHNQETVSPERVEELNARIDTLERANGRLSGRIDDLEDKLAVLQDRVEATRVAETQRRRADRAGELNEESPPRGTEPAPPPSTHSKPSARDESAASRRASREQSDRGTWVDTPNTSRTRPRDGSTSTATRSDDRPTSSQSDTSARDGSNEPKSETRSGNEGVAQGPSGDSNSAEEGELVITEEEFEKYARDVEPDSTENGDEASESTGSTPETTARSSNRPDDRSGAPSRGGDDSPTRPAEADADDESSYAGRSGLALYEMALAKFRNDEFEVALEGFEQFVEEGPVEDYADNGLYWIGECHYGLGEHRRAIEYFQRVLDEEPGGNKVPAAMLKMALAYRRIGERGKMESLLEQLTERYPESRAARLGRQELADLES